MRNFNITQVLIHSGGKASVFFTAILLLFGCSGQDSTAENPIMTFRLTNKHLLNEHVLEVPLDETVDKDSGKYLRAVILDDTLETAFLPEEGKLLVRVEALSPGDHELFLYAGAESIAFPKRTQAELSHKVGGHFENRKYIGGEFQNVKELHVPEEHTDHSYFIRYEGPGWESDKVGYRFYLDWRNGIDVFGKKTAEMVLQDVGQDGFDSYHHPADWGMDILKVGPSLGLGSIATWENGAARRVDVTDSVYSKIALNGNLRSAIETTYYGWDVASGKIDLESTISIDAGSRISCMELNATSGIDNICTGIIKIDGIPLMKGGLAGEFTYIATYGAQSLAEDKLGLAIIFPSAQLKEITEDENSHVVVFEPKQGEVSYQFLAAWEQEPNGINTEDAFKNYLDATISSLAEPVKIERVK